MGRYRIEYALGSGGMADVFYAVHEELRRPAAIKVLKASLAAEETNLQRFMNEARSAASLIHPNIVQVYDVGRDGDIRYIAQEYIPGANLRQYLAAPSLPPAGNGDANVDSAGNPLSREKRDPDTGDRQIGLSEALSILLQILAALNKSAASGIVHRDIKPENIMLTRDGEVKVADFGLARTFLGDDPKLTRVGTTLGTPMYMSPEQIQDGTVDLRSDLYSLGVTLYHMLAGRPPFLGDTPLALAMKHTQAEVPDIRQFRPELPDSIVRLLQRLLSKSPSDRFSDAGQILEYLKEYRSGDLQSVWPEHTLPLPGAVSTGKQPAIQATIALQARLQKPARSVQRKWLSRSISCLVLMAAFLGGAALTISSPFQSREPTSLFRGVPKQSDVESQFRFALLNENLRASRVDKWAAVEAYFPKEESELNRLYVGMANIQLARAFKRKQDYDEAKEALDRTINDAQMGDVYKAHAYLEKAIIEDELGENGSQAALEESVESALAIYRKKNIKDESVLTEKEQELLDEVVRLSNSERVENRWFSGKN